MAYKITNGQAYWAEVQQFNVDLFGAHEGKYILEEKIISGLKYGEDAYWSKEDLDQVGQTTHEVYFRTENGAPGDRVKNLEKFLLVLENYGQWKKEKKVYENSTI